MENWRTTARDRSIQLSALKIGLFVGSLLNLINQGPAMIAGAWASISVTKLLLTYCVPYCVAIYAGTHARRAKE